MDKDLIQAADLNMQNVSGDAPLYKAICNNNLNFIFLLINADAEINMKNNNEITPFHLLVVKG